MIQHVDGQNQTLSITIVGAGIAGLAAATALAQKGHNVTVLESKPWLNEFGASIGITSNGVRCLKALGLTKEFERVVTKNNYLEVRDGLTDEVLGHLPHNMKNFSAFHYGEEIWNINRKDYQRTLADAAEASGAKIIFDAEPEAIDLSTATITTVHGQKINADIIIGADGMKSAVRAAIPALSEVQPRPLREACFRCTVPKDKMRGNPLLEPLLTSGNEMVWTAPGRYVLAWPLPPNRAYDIVTCIKRDSDVPPGRWGMRADPDEATRDFQDFCPQVKELLSHIDSAVKWTLAELPPLPTCKTENGKAVLIGDAFHAMIPHAASGGNSAIEDAVCISECLDWAARNNQELSIATKAFEDLRKARVERMQTASQEGYGFLGAGEDFEPMRNAALAGATKQYDAELALSEAERQNMPKPTGDMHTQFPLEPYLQWLYNYDAIETTKTHLATLA